jgi:hypothetical protein
MADAGIVGEAVVLDSSRPGPRHREDITAGEVDVSDFGVGRHTLRLEVRLPGQEPYEVEGRFKVPPKVQFGRKAPLVARPLMKRSPIPAGITLPVAVNPANPEDVTIDWDGFLAAGGRDEMKRQHEAAGVDKMRADHPEQTTQMQEGAKATLETWVAGVQGGTLKRKDFDKSVDAYLKLGYLEPADAEAARQTLDG